MNCLVSFFDALCWEVFGQVVNEHPVHVMARNEAISACASQMSAKIVQ